MEIQSYQLEGIHFRFYYSPLQELASALHVAARPAHHAARHRWYRRLRGQLRPALLQSIEALDEVSGGWLLPLDMATQTALCELPAAEGIAALARWGLDRWLPFAKEYGITVSKADTRRITLVMQQFYEEWFANELYCLEPMIRNAIAAEARCCKEKGVSEYLRSLHERIEVEDSAFVFRKNKSYRFEKGEIHTIHVTVSTFLAPHLMLQFRQGELFLTRTSKLEEAGEEAPEDLVMTMQALSAPVRLRLLRAIDRQPMGTRQLAQQLGISPSTVSEHLKILHTAGLVEKQRKGHWVYYQICAGAIDFIPYKIFEFMRG